MEKKTTRLIFLARVTAVTALLTKIPDNPF